MSRPSDSKEEKGVNQNGDPGGHLSVFTNVHTAAVSPETRLLSSFKKDPHSSKVYLAGREYFSEEGQIFVPPHVGRIKQQINADPTLSPEYPSTLGLPEFTRRATEFTLGKRSRAIVENRVLGVQTTSCTAAVRLGAELLRLWCDADVSSAWCGPVYLASLCDDSLAGIFQAAGIQDIPSAHYPTGADLSQKDWTCLTKLLMKWRLFPFLLLPSQALCYGNLERDAWPVQYCASLGMELLCAQSFSHCFGLYGEAVGHLLCVLKHSSVLLGVQTQAEKIIRSLWAQPSAGGARVIATVLSNPADLVEWQVEVKRIVERLMLIRELLREKLRLLGSPGCWDHLIQQHGLYCCTGLNGQQVEFLSKRKHVYLLPGGCLNVSAINSRNVDYIAESIHLALTTSL
ncbi:hypothetical protein LDENG_00136150 [Lucifuga dentata]|nr:hypothetical protein LDENG_00136150 [Lucifuga dentata]